MPVYFVIIAKDFQKEPSSLRGKKMHKIIPSFECRDVCSKYSSSPSQSIPISSPLQQQENEVIFPMRMALSKWDAGYHFFRTQDAQNSVVMASSIMNSMT